VLVGASAAVAAEVAVAILLYGGPGFVRSLTTILAVEGFAFALGLWSAPAWGPDLVDGLRRRWLLCLFGFLGAAVFGTVWSLVPWLGEDRVGQALGLAILAGVPLYATGAVLGSISRAVESDAGRRLVAPGAPAAAGAALGFVLTGLLLPRAPMPASLLVACLVMLSLAGMAFGTVLGARTEIEIKARRPGRSGPVQVLVRRLPSADLASVELWEGAYLRRSRSESGEGADPWDVVVARALAPDEGSPWRVLVVGGGASGAPRAVLAGHATAVVDVLERTGAVVELGRDHFDTELAIGSGERCSVEVDNLDDAVAGLIGRYDLIFVDTAAISPLGGVKGLAGATRRELVQLLAPEGLLAWGPIGLEPGITELPEGWSRRATRRLMPWPADGGDVAGTRGADRESAARRPGGAPTLVEFGPLQAGRPTPAEIGEEHVVFIARNDVLSRLPDLPGFRSLASAERQDEVARVGPDTPAQ
jgi:hypothetical protein